MPRLSGQPVRLSFLAALMLAAFCGLAPAAGVAPSVKQRFLKAYGDEVSDFQRHVVPHTTTPTKVDELVVAQLRILGSSDEKAMSFAHAFLGVRLQCAQCHKHPYDQWTKQDFDQVAAFFDGVRYWRKSIAPAVG